MNARSLSVEVLKAENQRMRIALLAILHRCEGSIHTTDQDTGKTFAEIARDAIRDVAGLRA